MSNDALSETSAAEVEECLKRLPCGLKDADKQRRKTLFGKFDPNGNGVLSLAEVDKGLSELLAPTSLPKPVVNRAFHAARAIAKPIHDFNDDYIDANEFRVFLSYLHHYLKLWRWFCKIDSSSDRRVSLEEFKASLPLLQEWVTGDAFKAVLADHAKAFQEMDVDGGGLVLFDEFAHWVLKLGIGSVVSEEDGEERSEALKLLKQQKPNLATAEPRPGGEGTEKSRQGRPGSAAKSPGRSGSRGPSARQLSANRAAAKAAASRPPSGGRQGTRPGRQASPRPSTGSRPTSRGSTGSRQASRGQSAERRQAPVRAGAVRAAASAPLPAVAPPRAFMRLSSSSRPRPSSRAPSFERSDSRSRMSGELPSAHAMAAGRHTGMKAQAILAGAYDRGYV